MKSLDEAFEDLKNDEDWSEAKNSISDEIMASKKLFLEYIRPSRFVGLHPDILGKSIADIAMGIYLARRQFEEELKLTLAQQLQNLKDIN